jgi:ribosome-binding factor A
MKPKGLRQARLKEQIKEELSLMLLTRSEDPRFKEITLTQVALSSDLKLATVYFRILGDVSAGDMAKALEHAVPFLRHGLIEKLKIKILPDLRFRFDEVPDKAAQIDRLLDTLKETDHNA